MALTIQKLLDKALVGALGEHALLVQHGQEPVWLVLDEIEHNLVRIENQKPGSPFLTELAWLSLKST